MKKIPIICTCQTFLYYANWQKKNLRSFSKFTSGPEKNLKNIIGPSKPTIDFWDMPTPWENIFITWSDLMLKLEKYQRNIGTFEKLTKNGF